MLKSERSICQKMKHAIDDAEKRIQLLYTSPCIYSRYILLHDIRSCMQELRLLCNAFADQDMQAMGPGENDRTFIQGNRIDLTEEELSKYTGKGGKPAYVAINGTIYDVTGNAAWAAASHFGLTAGKDLSKEFASCHAGQQILNKLTAVGKLIG